MFLIKFTQTAVSHQDDLMTLIPAKYYIYLKAKHLPGYPNPLLTCGRRPEGRRHARIRHIRQPEPAANPSRTRAPHVSCWCRPRSPGRRRAYWNVWLRENGTRGKDLSGSIHGGRATGEWGLVWFTGCRPLLGIQQVDCHPPPGVSSVHSSKMHNSFFKSTQI